MDQLYPGFSQVDEVFSLDELRKNACPQTRKKRLTAQWNRQKSSHTKVAKRALFVQLEKSLTHSPSPAKPHARPRHRAQSLIQRKAALAHLIQESM